MRFVEVYLWLLFIAEQKERLFLELLSLSRFLFIYRLYYNKFYQKPEIMKLILES